MIITVEPERSAPTPDKGPRYRAFVRAAKGDHAVFHERAELRLGRERS
jgi:hypothetical protein